MQTSGVDFANSGLMFNVCPDALLDNGLLDFTLLFGSPGQQVRVHALKKKARTQLA
jgi:hypothetical protein